MASAPPTKYAPELASSFHTSMAPRLSELRAVWGGTESLLAENTKYLPKFEKEKPAAYDRRKAGARLRRNMFRQAVDRITGRIFEVPTKINEPSATGKIVADDADRRGNSFDRIARNLYRDTLKLGLRHILVEYPRVDAKNLAEERAANPRPYLVELEPEQILRCYDDANGHLTHLAWHVANVEWDEAQGQEVTVLRIHERFSVAGAGVQRVVIWKRQAHRIGTLGGVARPVMTSALPSAGGTYSWVVEEEYVVTQERIMLHTLYAEREALMVGRTPLTEVKDLTIEHFQIASDYRNCLRHVLFPILTVTGVEQKEVGDIVLGPDSVLGSTKADAKFAYLEHTGKAIEAGYKDLESLEQRAESYAGRLTKATGDVKATTEAIGAAEVSSFAKDLAVSLQDVLQAILDDCALWAGEDSLGRVEVNMDFAVDLPDGDMAALQSARTSGDLTRETLWKELSRRNVLARDFDPDEEKRLLDEQEAESMAREQEAMKFSAQLKQDTGSGSPFPEKQSGDA